MEDRSRLRSPTLSPSSIKRSSSLVRQKIEKLREKKRRRHYDRGEENGENGGESTKGTFKVLSERRDSIGSNYSASSLSGSGSEYLYNGESDHRGDEDTSSPPTHALTLPSPPPTPLEPEIITSFRKKQATASDAPTADSEGNTNGNVAGPDVDSNNRASGIQSSNLLTGNAFFSNMLSAAQNTFSSLTTGAAVKKDQQPISPGNRPKAETEPIPRKSGEFDAPITPSKAVATLGRGELSLSSILELNGTNPELGSQKPLEEQPQTSESASVTQLSTQATGAEPVAPMERSVSIARSPSKRRSVSVQRRRGSSASQSIPPVISPLIAPVAAPRFTGFAVASNKRNRDFHQLFRSVPEDDYLIEDYGCALSREILLQGRLYISEQHICFNSNIFGWVTNLVISFDEVMAIEKKTTVGLFPNAIVIQTLHARNVFASFISRDSTYELMCSIWRNGEQAASSDSLDESGSESEGDLDTFGGEESEGESVVEDGESEKVSGDVSENATGGEDIGPLKHPPTKCACKANEHYEKVVCDSSFSVPIGRICNLLWAEDTTWIESFMKNVLKVMELTTPTPWSPFDASGKKARTFNYIRPLNANIGPKQTKCLATETIENWEFENYVTVVVSTVTPDVPNGSIFVTKTRYCLTWGENNTTHMLITCGVEWSGKSWIKGPIEKGANDGQQQVANQLVAALNEEFQPKARKVKGRKRRGGKHKGAIAAAAERETAKKEEPMSLLATIMSLFGLGSDGTYITYVVIALFAALLIASLWLIFSGGKTEKTSRWDTLWDMEEQSLWEWLEDRTGHVGATMGTKSHSNSTPVRPKGWLSRREIEEAIQITQRRLDLLRKKMENYDG
ncbi:uncharacterized protein V1513DRAFT_449161 [Lipomyces chichibuensis]|uniref:uncharacterized protein n=1 Tax=Lipomyces chichibuensis TaxID=1546026 RepID=UPI003343304A